MKRKSDLSNYWINRAESLRDSALILFDSNKPFGLQDPVYMLSALSIEVLVKAIIVKQQQIFNEQYTNHEINKLIQIAGIKVTTDQHAMIGVFEETIFWLSKYPDPKKSKKYEDKIDRIWTSEKLPGTTLHISRPNDKRWPDKEKYLQLWHELMAVYIETPTENPNEFGYKLKGLER